MSKVKLAHQMCPFSAYRYGCIRFTESIGSLGVIEFNGMGIIFCTRFSSVNSVEA